MITSDPFGISHAERPWAGPGKRNRQKICTYDTAAQIARCQACERPDCVNCISACEAKHRRGRRDKEFTDLYGDGLTDADIAQRMGISTRTVRYYRAKYDLTPNAPKQDKDPCIACRSRDVCRSFGGTCRDKEQYAGQK